MPFAPRTLGRTGLQVGALGLAASYGAGSDAVEFAFDHGVNYFYWGSMRRSSFGEGLRRLAARRDRYALVIQSYSRIAALIPGSLERALRKLNTDYADVLLLGMWGRALPPRILDVCRRLKERGQVRYLAVSTHNRPLVPALAGNPDYEIFHVRYNAKHTGAERDIFPHLAPDNRPGIVSFTNTSWGQLLDPKRTPPGEQPLTATDCYRFVLSNPAVDLSMSGPSTMEQTKAAVRALDLGPLSAEEMARIRRIGAHMYGGKRPGRAAPGNT
jgi:aryl-alcohol dehydrogenase-like predicted oxidoreductase